MKKTFYILAVVAVFAACNRKSDLEAKKEIISLSDSTFYNSNYLTDTGAVSNTEDFTGGAVVSGKATVPARAAASSPRRRSSNGSYSNSNSTGNNSNSGTGTSTSTTAPKKGISKAAKGAIIGGVGGAVAGAVIGKNAKGAVIGGVVGAAGGYIIGRKKDRNDGRVNN